MADRYEREKAKKKRAIQRAEKQRHLYTVQERKSSSGFYKL